jgi:peptidoglycan hydrolase-like protein with peptidoglycan-binding domain
MEMQRKLGIAADGDFGPGTELAVKKWQEANGLTADGIVGPKTLAKLMA